MNQQVLSGDALKRYGPVKSYRLLQVIVATPGVTVRPQEQVAEKKWVGGVGGGGGVVKERGMEGKGGGGGGIAVSANGQSIAITAATALLLSNWLISRS